MRRQTDKTVGTKYDGRDTERKNQRQRDTVGQRSRYKENPTQIDNKNIKQRGMKRGNNTF